MSYLSLYRKYRSQSFSDLIGQDHVVKTLQNAVVSGKIAHAYLFTGPRGTGKTSSARLLAKCLNCEQGPTPEPCNACAACTSITLGNCVDVYEVDAASESGVENVRETIVEAVQYQPNFCRFKVFIIDEVHDLSPKAFDALLKTIEEPPAHVIFILATTEYNKVPPTIRSRCQKYEFHRATMQNLVDRLNYVSASEGVQVEPAAITAIARMADGGYRDALTLLEQAILTSADTVTLEHVYDQLGLVSEETVDTMLISIKEGNVAQLLSAYTEVARRGRDPRAIVESLMYRLSDLTRAAFTVDVGASGDATREASLFETASRLGRENLLWLRSAVSESHKAVRDVTLPRIWLEAELLRITDQGKPVAHPPVKAVVQETAATKPMPRQERRAESKPEIKPEPAVASTKSAEEPAVAQPPKSEPKKPSTPKDKWSAVVGELSLLSKAMGMRLESSRCREEGETLFIEFDRQMDVEWMTDKPAKHAAVLDKVREHYGPTYGIQFIVTKSENGKARLAESEAVELPLEGDALHKAASEILKPE